MGENLFFGGLLVQEKMGSWGMTMGGICGEGEGELEGSRTTWGG